MYYSYYPTDAVVNILPRGNEISTPLAKTVTNSYKRAVGTHIIIMLLLLLLIIITTVSRTLGLEIFLFILL